MKLRDIEGYNIEFCKNCSCDCGISQGNREITLNRERLIQNLLDTKIKESIRNGNKPYHNLGYKFTMFCSCGMCHIALLQADEVISALPSLIETVEEDNKEKK